MGLLDGKVAVITGAGRGIGRTEALLLASEGASVVVNDVGAGVTGEGSEQRPAQEVVDEIKTAGGTATANYDDITSWEGGQRLINQAIEELGGLDILVNNAGILRDRMSFNMEEADWDAVLNVHLKGHFVPSRFAGAYWRQKSKESGEPQNATIINTSSEAGLYGNAGQLNYGAAKAGIAAMTIILARELERFGVRSNAIAPRARTRMTEFLMGNVDTGADKGFDTWAPENTAALVGWLASDLSKGVTGQVFVITGGVVHLEHGWKPVNTATNDKPWTIDGIEGVRDQLFSGVDTGVPPFLMG
jgi:NAD(P)-dependent dehydrogenase (short-subunit alcohol dehydrogenase family)